MRLNSISIENFGGFKTAELEFPQGLVSVSGRNFDMNGANSNGSGKSCLFDAIAWGLFGKTLRDDGPADIIRRGENKAVVTINFKVDDRTFRIVRSKTDKGGVLQFWGSPDCDLAQSTMALTQGKIDAVLGMDYRIFRAVATFAEDALRFAGATDKEQKDILERLLSMEIYGEALTKTKAEYSIKSEEWRKKENELAYTKRQAFEESTEALRLETELLVWADTVNKEVDLLENKSALVDAKLLEITKEREALIEQRQIIEGMMIAPRVSDTEERRRYDEASKEEYRLAAEATQLRKAKEALERSIQTKEQELERVSDRIGKACGECGRPVTEAELGSAQECIAQKVLELYTELETAKEAFQKAHTAALEAGQRVGDTKKALNYVQDQINAYNGKMDGLATKRNLIDKEIAAKELRAQVIKDEVSGLERKKASIDTELSIRESRIADARKRATATGEKVLALERGVEQNKAEQEYYDFWVKAFGYGGIRSVLLDGVAEKLTERTNHYLKILTDGTVWVQFSTLSETKAGEARERFEVKVFNNFGAGTYAGNSGGERQRIDICIALALHWLVRTRAAKPLGFAIFDEVFERMDETGCEFVVNLLRQEQADLGTMFVVSHNPALSARFPQSIEVEKRGGVSRIVKPDKQCADSKQESASPETAKSEKPTPEIESNTTSKPKRTRKKSTVTSKSP